MSSQPETAAEQVATISGSARWLAALLGVTTMPAGYTIAVFHDDSKPIEHFTLKDRPVEGDNPELLLASIQYTILHHQAAHFAGAAGDSDWAAAIARITERGDFGNDLSVGEMQAVRTRIQAAESEHGLMAALLAATEEDPESEAGGIRGEAIRYL